MATSDGEISVFYEYGPRSLVDYPLTMRLDLVSSGVLKIGYMAVNTNGRRFAICSEFGDSEILEVNIDWGEVYRECGQKLDGLISLAFGTDELLATGFEDGTLAIWEITDRGLQNRREGNVRHTDAVCSLAFSPNGDRIVTGSGLKDRNIIIWDTATGDTVGEPLTGHRGPVLSVAWSSDEEFILSGSDDFAGTYTVRMWNSEGKFLSGRTIGQRSLQARNPSCSVAFTPGSTAVVLVCGDGSAQMWDVVSGEDGHLSSNGTILSNPYGTGSPHSPFAAISVSPNREQMSTLHYNFEGKQYTLATQKWVTKEGQIRNEGPFNAS